MTTIRCARCSTAFDGSLPFCPSCDYFTSFLDHDSSVVTLLPPPIASQDSGRAAEPAAGRSIVQVSPSEVEVLPRWGGVVGRPAIVDVTVKNMSHLVDEFVITITSVSSWMQVTSGKVDL